MQVILSWAHFKIIHFIAGRNWQSKRSIHSWSYFVFSNCWLPQRYVAW